MLVEAIRAFEGIVKGQRFEVHPNDDNDRRLMAFVHIGVLKPVLLDDGDAEAIEAFNQKTEEVAAAPPAPTRRRRRAVPATVPVENVEDGPSLDMFAEKDN